MSDGIARTGKLADQLPQQRSADLQRALVERRKRPSGEEDRRDGGVLQFARAEVLGHHRDLLGLLGGGGDTLAQLG